MTHHSRRHNTGREGETVRLSSSHALRPTLDTRGFFPPTAGKRGVSAAECRPGYVLPDAHHAEDLVIKPQESWIGCTCWWTCVRSVVLSRSVNCGLSLSSPNQELQKQQGRSSSSSSLVFLEEYILAPSKWGG